MISSDGMSVRTLRLTFVYYNIMKVKEVSPVICNEERMLNDNLTLL